MSRGGGRGAGGEYEWRGEHSRELRRLPSPPARHAINFELGVGICVEEGLAGGREVGSEARKAGWPIEKIKF